MLDQRLKALKIPPLLKFLDGQELSEKTQWEKRRQEIIDILCREEYGFLPPAPKSISSEILKKDEGFCAGKVTLTEVLLKVELEHGLFSFPVYCAIPKDNTPHPAFLHINFRDAVPDKYMPTEEICDNGFAVISFCYKDVTSDDEDFSTGLAGVFYQGRKRESSDPGKIALWAWAALRVMDFIQTLDNIDKKNISVVGHSRLGKTALLAGGLDERFAFTISNDSGCSGAAISRGKSGETIKDICSRFPYWFCENYHKYAEKEDKLPFDQHFLLSLPAPRRLYIASAEKDTWADPLAEYLCCVAAKEAYTFLESTGFIYPDRLPEAGDSLQKGCIGYHLRTGSHYLSRYDWLRFMEFILKHKN